MKHTAIIVNFNFMPMVNGIASILHVWVKLDYIESIIIIEEQGSIKDLSDKYHFRIEGEHSWNFSGLIGSKCNVVNDQNGYRFVSFIN